MRCYASDIRLAGRLSQTAAEASEIRRLLRRLFPQWIHCGLIEADRVKTMSDLAEQISAVDSLRPH